MKYDVMIIGAGPAGLSAALYCCRSGLHTGIMEKEFAGGQLTTVYEVENYPGTGEKVFGTELAYKMEKQAREAGAEFISGEVTSLDILGEDKKVMTTKETYEAKSIILCPGAKPQELGLPKERELRGMGVSYCATCDGAFFRGKTVVVVGGGNRAIEDAIFLSRGCEKVYLVHRRDAFRAEKKQQEIMFATKNIEVIYHSVIREIIGQGNVSGVVVENKDGQQSTITAQGLFVEVGTKPSTDFLVGAVPLTSEGYINTDSKLKVADGIYAAGDARDGSIKQIVVAAADGAVAAFEVLKYITERGR